MPTQFPVYTPDAQVLAYLQALNDRLTTLEQNVAAAQQAQYQQMLNAAAGSTSP